MNFKDMHYQSEPLLICNVWDASSSRVAEKLGFQAVGTSSGAIAASLGYEDGEEISFSELKFMIEQIAKASSLPLTVDLESGYGDGPEEIADNIKVLTELGVVGINIEDSKVNETRELVDPETFCELLVEVRKILEEENIDLFINVRVDTYIMTLMSGMPQPLEETIKRIKVYEKAGVDGIFVPFISNSEDITEVTSATSLPVSVLAMPGLPDFDDLKELGVKRISMGTSIFENTVQYIEKNLACILQEKSFNSIF